MGICCFCGHRNIPASVHEPLKRSIEALIQNGEATDFYLGNHGQFDAMVLSTLQSLQLQYPYIRFWVVLAYMPGKKSCEESISTMYPEGLEKVPRRYAIIRRNQWMVKQSDYLIAYVTHDYGGAAQTLQYAQRRKNIKIFNLADWKANVL